jgi:hypothetical protein
MFIVTVRFTSFTYYDLQGAFEHAVNPYEQTYS